MTTKLSDTFKIIFLSIVLSIGLSYVYAWTAPTATPPGGNVASPINTSDVSQTKLGILGVKELVTDAITVSGNVEVNDVYITSIGKYASELYPSNLFNGQHTVTQCSSLGGSSVDIGGGNKLCRLVGASCPIGWVKYSNWSSTQNTTGTYLTSKSGDPTDIACLLKVCSSGGHVWSDVATESPTCYGIKAKGCGTGYSVTVTATVTEVGCY